MAASAVLHCLTGCAIGEIVGLLIGTAMGVSNPVTIGLAIVLAFLFVPARPHSRRTPGESREHKHAFGVGRREDQTVASRTRVKLVHDGLRFTSPRRRSQALAYLAASASQSGSQAAQQNQYRFPS